MIRTRNSDYRILLLDPATGRSLLEGGTYLIEPTEGFLAGSKLHGALFKRGAITVGYHLEMWVDEKLVSTSPVQALTVQHRNAADSIDSVTEAFR